MVVGEALVQVNPLAVVVIGLEAAPRRLVKRVSMRAVELAEIVLAADPSAGGWSHKRLRRRPRSDRDAQSPVKYNGHPATKATRTKVASSKCTTPAQTDGLKASPPPPLLFSNPHLMSTHRRLVIAGAAAARECSHSPVCDRQVVEVVVVRIGLSLVSHLSSAR